MLLTFTGSGRLSVHAVIGLEPPELAARISADRARAFALVHSGWATHLAEPHAEREELLVVTAADSKEHLTLVAAIVRNPDDPPRLGRWRNWGATTADGQPPTEGAEVTGWFVKPLRAALT